MSRTTPIRRARWRVAVAGAALAGLTIGAASFAPAAGADTPGDPPTTASTTSTTSSTTTTTVPHPSGTVALAPGAPAPSVPEAPAIEGDRSETTIAPLLPSDSLAAAMADLTSLQATQAELRAQHDRIVAERNAGRATQDQTRIELEAARRRRRDRAVRAYIDASSSAALDQLLNPKVDDARLAMLASAADRADRKRLRSLESQVEAVDTRLGQLDAEQRANDDAAANVTDQIDGVMAKLAAASAAIGPAGQVIPADASSGAIGRLARAAEEALVADGLAATRAAEATTAATAAPTDPDAAAAVARATQVAHQRSDDDTAARGRLAAAVSEASSADADTLGQEWSVTPAPAMRATYFALSQVGKPYVYATDGPNTYDCSGLTRRAWEQNGIALPHFSGAQLHAGVPVAPPDLRPGDLLTYGPDGGEHVVLYIGGGFDVEAKGRAWGVVVERASTNPGRFAGASRPMP